MLAAKFRRSQSALRMFQYAHNLGFAKSALSYRNLLVHRAEKILPMQPLTFRGDFRASGKPGAVQTAREIAAIMGWKESYVERILDKYVHPLSILNNLSDRISNGSAA